MKSIDVQNYEISFFVENGSRRYQNNDNITFLEFFNIYLNANGFFVLIDKDNKPIKYIEINNIDEIENLLDEKKNHSITIKELIDDKKLNFKDDFINESEKLFSVLDKLGKSNQKYYPVINKDGELIGRVSKENIKMKLNKLFPNLNF